jgi:hypothetical protein
MATYRAGERVTPGVYFDHAHHEFVTVTEEGPHTLPNDGGPFKRVHALAAFLAAPWIGLAYVVSLPAVALVATVKVVGQRLVHALAAPQRLATDRVTPD